MNDCTRQAPPPRATTRSRAAPRNTRRREGRLSGAFLLFLLGSCLLVPPPAVGHRVQLFVYPVGGEVHAEGYFGNGNPCEGCRIEARAPDGKLVAEGATDAAGRFSFPVKRAEELEVLLRAGPGHERTQVLGAEELLRAGAGRIPAPPRRQDPVEREPSPPAEAGEEGTEARPLPPRPDPGVSPPTHEGCVDAEVLRSVLAEVLEEKLAPLRRQVRQEALEANRAPRIIGGVGYIVGLAGLVLYLHSRRRNASRDRSS